jgi:hypothetical protein
MVMLGPANSDRFSGLQVPMRKCLVKRMGRDAGVGLGGVTVRISRDPGLIGRGLLGHTSPDGATTLYPDAFGFNEVISSTFS